MRDEIWYYREFDSRGGSRYSSLQTPNFKEKEILFEHYNVPIKGFYIGFGACIFRNITRII
jgi:hypothetical protein